MVNMDRFRSSRSQRPAQHASPAQSYELSPVPSPTNTATNAHQTPMAAFLAEVSAIQSQIFDLNALVREIDALNRRALNPLATSPSAEATPLDDSMDRARRLTEEIKSRLTRLGERDTAALSPGERLVTRNQTSLVRKKFVEALQTYQTVQQDFRAKSKQRVERTYHIVNPNATPEEVQQVISGNLQVQATAGMYVDPIQARSAMNEVQQRQHDLRKMEQSLMEVAQLMQDMAYLIDKQDETIKHIEVTAGDVEKNAAAGLEQTEEATRLARAARKKRWIMFGIIAVILLIIAIALAVYFGTMNR